MSFYKNQNGNALWFIMIAVVLLGALTMALSRGGSSVDQSADSEQMTIKASQLIRYAKGIEAGVDRLILNGCSENEISFENPVDNNYDNPNSPDDESCHIFQPEGAGLTWQSLTNETLAVGGEGLLLSGRQIVFGLEDETRADLIVAIPVSQSLCNHINTEFGISTTASDITSDIDSWIKFAGTYEEDYRLGNGAGEAPGLNGFSTGCFIDDNGDYVFYHVLLAR